MKKFYFLLVALVAVAMTSCVRFKTEATVDVKVIKDGQPVPNAVVYKFKDNGLGPGSTLYKSNASGNATTNAGGVAHFDLKSPDDLDPSNVAGLDLEDQATFYFCTYDAEDTRNGIVTVSVKTGDKIFDLQESTYWSTNRGVQFPHYLIIDLGQDQTFTGFQYLPRVEAGAPESIKQYRIYVKSGQFKGL